ncbi:unnamed protein product, partial [Staurois parvus]
MGPYTASSAPPGPISKGSLYGLPLLLSPSPHSAKCYFQVSSHCWFPESVMGPCTASHCCCLHRHTLPCATFRSPH